MIYTQQNTIPSTKNQIVIVNQPKNMNEMWIIVPVYLLYKKVLKIYMLKYVKLARCFCFFFLFANKLNSDGLSRKLPTRSLTSKLYIKYCPDLYQMLINIFTLPAFRYRNIEILIFKFCGIATCAVLCIIYIQCSMHGTFVRR